MPQNRLPDNLADLISLAEDCADGAHQYGAQLKQNTEADIRSDLDDLVSQKSEFDTAA